MKCRKVTKAIILGILLCVAAGIGYLYYSYSTRVYKHCVIEAGTPVTAQDFLKDPSKEAVCNKAGTGGCVYSGRL